MKMPLLRYLLLLVSACVPCCDKAHAEAAPQEAEAPQPAAGFIQEEITDVYMHGPFSKTGLFCLFTSISLLLLLTVQWHLTGDWPAWLVTLGLTSWVVDLYTSLSCFVALSAGSRRVVVCAPRYYPLWHVPVRPPVWAWYPYQPDVAFFW